MGVYTTIRIGKREGQVKLWNDQPEMVMAGVTVESSVPNHEGHSTYSIAMREGGYVNIINGEIFPDEMLAWTTHPLPEAPVFDKWGDPFTSEAHGLMEDIPGPYRRPDPYVIKHEGSS